MHRPPVPPLVAIILLLLSGKSIGSEETHTHTHTHTHMFTSHIRKLVMNVWIAHFTSSETLVEVNHLRSAYVYFLINTQQFLYKAEYLNKTVF